MPWSFHFFLLFCLNFRSFYSSRFYLKVKQNIEIKIKKLRKKNSMKDVHNNPQAHTKYNKTEVSVILTTLTHEYSLF